MADVPKLAQACRTAMDSELPCGTRGRGRSARLHWVSGPMSSDTDVLAVGVEIYKNLEIGDFMIKVNHRELLDSMMEIMVEKS